MATSWRGRSRDGGLGPAEPQGPRPRLDRSRRADGTWTRPWRPRAPLGYLGELSVDRRDGRAVVAWTRFAKTSQVRVVVRVDGTWTRPQRVSAAGFVGDEVKTALDDRGRLRLSWMWTPRESSNAGVYEVQTMTRGPGGRWGAVDMLSNRRATSDTLAVAIGAGRATSVVWQGGMAEPRVRYTDNVAP